MVTCPGGVGFPGGSDGKVPACNAGDPGSMPGSGRPPGEGTGSTPVLLPGKFHGWRAEHWSRWGAKTTTCGEI